MNFVEIKTSVDLLQQWLLCFPHRKSQFGEQYLEAVPPKDRRTGPATECEVMESSDH